MATVNIFENQFLLVIPFTYTHMYNSQIYYCVYSHAHLQITQERSEEATKAGPCRDDGVHHAADGSRFGSGLR